MGQRDSSRPSLTLAQLLRSAASPSDFTDEHLVEVALAADRMGLAPALWGHGVRAGWWHPVPDDAAELVRHRSDKPFGQPELALQASLSLNRKRIADLLAQGEDIEIQFRLAGIRPVRLKGWHTISAGWWPDPAERTMTDLDVLVSLDRSDEASDILRGMGYVAIESGHTSLADHELAPVRLPGHAGSVEVHLELLLKRWAGVLGADEVLDGDHQMSTTDAATHLIAHAQLQDESYLLGRVPWRALYELALLLQSDRRSDIDWNLVRSRFADAGAERALDGFLWQSSMLFGADVPPRSGRVPTRSRLALAVVDRPRLGAAFAWLAYLPRSLSANRMRALEPDRPPWRTRLEYIVSSARAKAKLHP